VKERLRRSGAIYARSSSGRLLSRPRHRDESAYLLTGFARCGVCGGTIGTDLRAHGSAGSRAHIPHYGCLDHKRRGAAVCTNSVGLNQRLLDQAILAAISALLDEHVLGAAVDRACTRLTADVGKHRAQLMGVERELTGIQLRIERLLDALGDGSLPRDEVAGRLNAEKSRKDTLTAERGRLTSVLRATDIDAARIKAELLVKIQDVKALLGRHIPQARQMLRKLLADKIELEPVGHGRERGYKFRGALTVDRLIAGDTLAKPEINNTSDGGGPNGIRTRVSVAITFSLEIVACYSVFSSEKVDATKTCGRKSSFKNASMNAGLPAPFTPMRAVVSGPSRTTVALGPKHRKFCVTASM
jgi:hypothetical protein